MIAPATPFRVVMAQLNFLVGDIAGNTDKIIAAALAARDRLQADLIVFPELALTGYPPEDLLLRPGFIAQVEPALQRLRQAMPGIAAVIGCPNRTSAGLRNAAVLLDDGAIQATYCKQLLPNYSVFDEKRYFIAGTEPGIATVKGVRVGMTVCEDAWQPDPMAQATQAGAQLLVNLNASPYHAGKGNQRLDVLRQRVAENGVPIVYVNLLGGQDELVFDGGSMVVGADGTLIQRAPFFAEGLYPVDFQHTETGLVPVQGPIAAEPGLEEGIYQALVLGVRDYVQKNGFPGVVLGLSGGIDSALTLAIAVDALGAERVEAVSMPSRYTADMSNTDAELEANALGVNYYTLPIEPTFQAFLQVLQPVFAGLPPGIAEENIQARCRGVLLMAISNKTGKMVLTTGNKSETAVGYSTLYGDMAGGFAPIKDVLKTMVYRLSAYRNSLSPVIPQRVIDRPPSAELRPDQTDQDSLPPYDVLDAILHGYVEQDRSVEELIAAGFDRATVERVARLVIVNEYKRRQAAPGVRITPRAFGRDRRYPITSGFRR
ncbi:putative glutamine-dependent NAD(+) synthetase (NAD(+) synthase (glutamine-hydrolyzing)) (NadE) [Candidatus Competibacter denitrificans Run_A_D11]|uniref:Glutamine-dependent NAD(+) synthetase n=1 Tax=Candidatus Competibacter denitrificans Run_A_D11 TaxID=1400863 RepID=W6M0A4_9GAMM|nr:NAD+ synthase [Candidatus Competibacter denitrificans]CDI00796.1 putative glutamine-dependent NAD(+) synthetase (NAD(+) synthase (glutamine-hydrolyzing)) (NadE) [Candidatus Competibacter denitrificans Run_A_D11]HCK82064.1 NAD+ synthase [Candidatus Competibacteraceae bacterium]HRC69680.1 NAD+ synthase [Candidatus Competibacter denitrificans]